MLASCFLFEENKTCQLYLMPCSPTPHVKSLTSNDFPEGFTRVVSCHMRPLPQCGNKKHVNLIQRWTCLLCHHPQAQTWPNVSIPPVSPRPICRCMTRTFLTLQTHCACLFWEPWDLIVFYWGSSWLTNMQTNLEQSGTCTLSQGLICSPLLNLSLSLCLAFSCPV